MGDGTAGARRVLADVSNQLGKRRFVSVSSNSAGESMENEPRKSDCVSRKGSENSFNGNCESEVGNRGGFPLVKPKKPCGSLSSDTGIKSQQDNPVLDISKVPRGSMKIMGLFDGNFPFVRRDALMQSVMKSGDVCVSSLPGQGDNSSSIIVGGESHKEGDPSDTTLRVNNAVNKVSGDNDEGIDGAADLTSNKSSSIGCSIVSGSSGSQVFGAHQCSFFSGDAGMDTSGGVDLLNSCSCSFCRKAAYIWADLHYQDVKGRIAALKRSKKEVRSAVDRRYNYSQINQNVQGESGKSTKLEADLMGQWRSLFLNTEDILSRESNQLQSNLVNLKDLRDNCKDDLEVINATLSNS